MNPRRILVFIIWAASTVAVIAIMARTWGVAALWAITALLALVFWKDLDQEDGRP